MIPRCLARRTLAVAALGVPALLGVPGAAIAQRVTTTLDAGGARVRYADSLDATTVTVSPGLRMEWSGASVATSVAASAFAGGAWSTQATLAASGFTRPVGPFRGELSTSLGGSAHQDHMHTGQVVTNARIYAAAGWGGMWGGAGLGRTWDGRIGRGVKQGEVGAWAARGAGSLVGVVMPTAVEDTLRYTDAQLLLHLERAAVEIDASAGVRAGAHLPMLGGTARRWGSVSATAWVAPTKAIVLSVGAYPVDFTQGFPGGRYLSLSARYQRGRRAPAPREDPVSDSAMAASRAAGIQGFRVEPGQERGVLKVRAPAATSVDIRGDFTAWDAAALERGADGWWSLSLPLPPGTYQMNVRVDGRAWTVPPGLVVLTDEFGVRAGVIAIDP